MTLSEKLETISRPKIKPLPSGKADSIEELWNKLILPYLPKRDAVLAWNDLLIGYVNSEHPMLAIRGYNTFPKDKYGDLRRGFLTDTQDFSFFYTDNFFAAYFQKMCMDGFVPTLEELISAFKDRKFPSRFGPYTDSEKELCAIEQGKNPGISYAGFKIAHIVDAGKNYHYNGRISGTKYILDTYFPKGERDDWKIVHDQTGSYHLRHLNAKDDAKQIATAHFLRFVNPFNYFLCPKKNCEINDKCKELAEYQPLLDYAHDYNLKVYGEAYREFLKYIMLDEHLFSPCFDSTKNCIEVEYCLGLTGAKKSVLSFDFDAHAEMLAEYLQDPTTSFIKLEIKYLNGDTQKARGFKSRSIINYFGITAEHKGILSKMSIEDFIHQSTDTLRETLLKIKSYLREQIIKNYKW